MKRAALLCLVALACGAWSWDLFFAPATNQLRWHACNGQFTADQEDEIELAALGWNAGWVQQLRGASWRFRRGANRTWGSCSPNDGESQVYTRSQTWFSNRGYGTSALAVCLCSLGYSDYDIAFSDWTSWSTDLPSATSDISVGQVALHEFGHVLGLNHDNTHIATMNTQYPSGGDISAVGYRPNEDDFAGLKANRPHASAGTNLLLSRFVSDTSDPGDSLEVWDEKTSDWTVCDGIVADPDGPEPISILIHGTTCETPNVEWWLSSDTTCDFAAPDHYVGSRQPYICPNQPYAIHPNPYDFTGVPPGEYTLCAYVDPDDRIAETDTTDVDNDLVSEVTVTVQACP